MDASIASDRDPSSPLKALALAVGGVAAVSLVSAAAILVLRWVSGEIDPRTAGGFTAVTAAAVVLAGATAAGLRPFRRRFPRRSTADGKVDQPAAANRAAPSPPWPEASPWPEAKPWPEARLVQRIERYERQAADGSVVEAAIGRVVVRFAEGSRTAVAHVGFCPPFAATPRVAASNACDGVEVDVAAAEVLPWGVRIECRLEEPSEEPLDVDVEIVAEPPESR